MASNNPTPTVTLQSTLAEILNIAVKDKASHQIVRFDCGQGREVAFVAFAEDTYGYLQMIQAYADVRDQYAARVANAVVVDIRENGMPEPGSSLNLIKSSDGESLLPPTDADNHTVKVDGHD